MLSAIFLFGCAKPENPKDELRESISETTVLFNHELFYGYIGYSEIKKLDLSFLYKDSFFDADATVFSKDLAMVSFGNALMAHTEKDVSEFYKKTGFDDVDLHFEEETGLDSVSFSFAHKAIGGKNLVSVSFRGNDYYKEWANNFELGESGNHQGFYKCALKVYGLLKNYVSRYDNLSLWINGYSRGGAIANVLSHIILSKKEINVVKNDMFVYTFGTPKALDFSGELAYENVFNVINSRDIITHFVPEKEYGLKRCGIDIDIYSENAEAIIREVVTDVYLPTFMPDNYNYKTEKEFVDYLFSTITAPKISDDDPFVYISTREEYVSNIQRPLETALLTAFGLPENVLTQIMTDTSSRLSEGLPFILGTLGKEYGLYDYIVPYLNDAGYSFDESVLREDSEQIRKFILGKLAFVSTFTVKDSKNFNNVMRLACMHFAESYYALINALVE